jgi:integrase
MIPFRGHSYVRHRNRFAGKIREARRLIGTAGHRMHNFIVVALLTGARTEELRALRWAHVHMGRTAGTPTAAASHLEVWRSVRTHGDTKTRRSRRTLALPARCVEALLAQQAMLALERTAAGGAWVENDLVFPTKVGTLMDKDNARRAFRSALAPVPCIDPEEWTPRELRHSFVSLLSDSGVPIEEISRLVGHSGTSVTELVYRHQIRPVIQTGAVVMDELFGSQIEIVSPSDAEEALPADAERASHLGKRGRGDRI